MKTRNMFRWTPMSLAMLMACGLACNKESTPPEKTPEKPVSPATGDNKPTPAKPTTPEGDKSPATKPAATAPAATQAQSWEPTEKVKPKSETHPRVQMRVRQGSEDFGWIVLELDRDKAPITVDNFMTYVDEGYFNGTIFHRVMPNFMVQGGGFTAIGAEKQQGQHPPIVNEGKNGLKNERYTIAMARTNAPDSATSQFFINVADNDNLNYPSFDGHGYAVFGKVIEGTNVVDRIKAVSTHVAPDDRRPKPEKSVPDDPPVIVVAERVK